MEANVHGLFRDDQLRASSSAKRPSKSRSRVWEKVVWFTRKAKGGKESKSDPGVFAHSPGLRRRNKHDVTSFGLNTEDCGTGTPKIGKAEQKVRKSRSFNYLRRRKLRQFADDLSCVMPEENRDLQNCHTATGTFHDFKSERRISRQEVCMSSVSLFSELTKGINGSQPANENVRSILSLPLDELTLNDSPSRSLCTSPNLARNVRFSGPAYNSWPRKKRTHLGNGCGDVLSPPLKQKRVSGLKKRATFSGFDSSKLISRNPSFYLRMGARSTPQLEHCGQIKNQNGSTVGVIHFFKSTTGCRSEDRTEKIRKRDSYCSGTKKDQSIVNGRSHTLVCPQNCDEKETSSNYSSIFPAEFYGSSKNVTKISRGDLEVTKNTASTVCKNIYHDNVVSSDKQMCDADVIDGTNCLTFNIRSADGPNSAISAFVVEGDKCFNNNYCILPSPGNCPGIDSVEEEFLSFSGCPVKTETPITVVDDNVLDAGHLKGHVSRGSNIICGEKSTVGCCSTLVRPNEDKVINTSEYSHSLGCLTSLSSPPKNEDNCESVDSSLTEVSQPAATHVSESVASAESGTNCKNHVSGFRHNDSDVSHMLPFGDELDKSEAPDGSWSRSDKNQSDFQKGKMFWSRKPRVKGLEFKQQMEVILQWFSEFNHEQKNALMKRLLDQCELPQMHMLSVAMEPILHKDCPPNCQDMLSWLPHSVTSHILSFLDPVSLCQCGQVNRTWNSLTSNSVLWKNLCGHPDWQLSRIGEENERKNYVLPDGTMQWKKMFASRFLLYQNWLKGRCEVRTFEGHTQGISCVQFDDTRIVSGSSDKTIRVWDIQSGDSDAVLTLAGHSGTVRCLNLNGNRLVSGSVDRSIKVWDLSFKSYWSGASCKVTMVGHMHTVRCLQVDDEKVVSGSYDKTLKVWDIKTGHCKLTLRGHNAAVLCVQFDERKIVSGSSDKTIKVWCLSEGSCLMTLTGHHDAVTCLNLTFDSRKVISGSLDHNLKFWDLATGKCIGTLDWIRSEGHTGVIRCLQTDSWRIVSAGDDKTLKMWSLESGQRLLTLRCHTDGVTCLQFNDYSIVSGSYDKTVKFWDFTPAHEFLTPG